jgi:tetratricopeptide (TPR) repeat protein
MREVLEQASNSAQRELADEPALLGDITRTIGLTYAALNEHDKALTQLNRALTLLPNAPLRERLALRTRIADTKDAVGLFKDALADCETIYQETLRGFGPLDADTLRSRQSLSEQLNRNGQHQRALGDALSLQPDIEKVVGADSALALDNRLTIAMARSDLGQVDEAVRDYREVLRARTRLYGEFHSKVNAVWTDLAIVYLRNQRFTDAEQLLRPQLPGVLKRFGETNYVTIQSYALMASALRYSGKLEESGSYYKFAVEQARKRYGPKNGLTLGYETNYANFEVASGRPASALEIYNRIEPIISEQRGAESPPISELRRGRAKALTLLGRRAEAIADWQAALVIDRKSVIREDHPRVQEALAAIKELESGTPVKVP